MKRLSINNHDRKAAGLKYVYPVISRRAGGLSIGVNFNINNACNWRCVYCQVPDLSRGGPPPLNIDVLKTELNEFLDFVLHGDFYQQFDVPEQQRVIKDIAISGNGEPTSLSKFAEAVECIGELADKHSVFPTSHFVLISNGSLMHQQKVQAGLQVLKAYAGEVWFKIDSATEHGREQINDCRLSQQRLFENLSISSQLCKTKIQTCLLNYAHFPWSSAEKIAYLALLKQVKDEMTVQDILLYTLARPSCQPEAELLQAVSFDELQEFADQIGEMGFNVQVNS